MVDLAKFRKKLDKIGISDIDFDTKTGLWVSSGNHALNYLMTKDFDRAFSFGTMYVYAGESGSGKSYMCAKAAANAQRDLDARIIWIDSENASDSESGMRWFSSIGVDVSDDRFLYIPVGTMKDVVSIISSLSDDYKKNGDTTPTVVVVDSWINLVTETAMTKVESGDLPVDQGQRAKQLKTVMMSIGHLIRRLPILLLGVTHVYETMNMYQTKKNISGGEGLKYMSQGVIRMDKKKLTAKDLENPAMVEILENMGSNILSDVRKKIGGDARAVGIISRIEVEKSRTSRHGLVTHIHIHHDTGLDPYSGLFTVMMAHGFIRTSSKGWFEYVNKETGEVVKFRRKELYDNDCRLFHDIMEHGIGFEEDTSGEDTPGVENDETGTVDDIDEDTLNEMIRNI